MCFVLSENEKEKKNKDESDRPNREERIVRYVVGEDGLGGARVGLKKSDFLFSFLFFLLGWAVTATFSVNNQYPVACS